MNPARSALLALLICTPAQAFVPLADVQDNPLLLSATTTLLPSGLSYALGDFSEQRSRASSHGHDARLLRDARDEAALFIASAGAYRGARLEAALRVLRRNPAQHGRDDHRLALALLGYTHPARPSRILPP